MTLFNYKSLIIFILLSILINLLDLWTSNNLLFTFFMPSDRGTYFESLTFLDGKTIVEGFVRGNGNYLHTLFYSPIISVSPINQFLTVFITNVLICHSLIRFRVNSLWLRLIYRSYFLFLCFGMTKELFMIVFLANVTKPKGAIFYWLFSFVRPQVTIITIISKAFKRMDSYVTLFFSAALMFFLLRFEIFNVPQIFLQENGQSKAGILINELLNSINPLFFIVGLFLSFCRFWYGIIMSLQYANLEIIIQLIMVMLYFYKLRWRNLTSATRFLHKFLILLLVVCICYPFPMQRYFLWGAVVFMLRVEHELFWRQNDKANKF